MSAPGKSGILPPGAGGGSLHVRETGPSGSERRVPAGPKDMSLRVRENAPGQTFFSFHFPRRKSSEARTASVENAIGIARKTPRGPRPVRRARNHASGISNSQKQNRFSQVGVQVSPAPLNAWTMTISNA